MKYKISRFNQVKRLNQIVSDENEYIGKEVYVFDKSGSKADARSLLGLMSLNYDSPVTITCSDNNLVKYIIEKINIC